MARLTLAHIATRLRNLNATKYRRKFSHSMTHTCLGEILPSARQLFIQSYLVSFFVLSSVFLTATPNPASGLPTVATITSNRSGPMRAMLRKRRDKKTSSPFLFFFTASSNSGLNLLYILFQIFLIC